MSAEVLYRDEERKFSVYRLADIPDGVPRSGAAEIGWWRRGAWEGFLRYLREHAAHSDHEWFVMFTSAAPFGAPKYWHCCAVLDEHAGPLLAPRPRFRVGDRVQPSEAGRGVYRSAIGPGRVTGVKPSVLGDFAVEVTLDGRMAGASYSERVWEPISIEARIEDVQSSRAHEIGAQRWRDAREVPGPIGFLADDRAAWSAELRFLVDRSEAARRATEPSVGWDPYGDDA